MTTDLREFKVGDVIQDKKKKGRFYIIGSIDCIEKLNLYDLEGEVDYPIRVPKGDSMIMKHKYSYKDDAEEEVCDFQLVDSSIVEKYYLNEGEPTEKFRKKLEELKGKKE